MLQAKKRSKKKGTEIFLLGKIYHDAMRLILGNDPFSLQELLGHEDISTVKNYMHMNDETVQEQKRKYSPGDHLPTRMPGPRETRRQNGTRKTPGRKREE